MEKSAKSFAEITIQSSGESGVREFVRQISKKRLTYQSRFFDTCRPVIGYIASLQGHLLAEPPATSKSFASHSTILDEIWISSDIDSFID